VARFVFLLSVSTFGLFLSAKVVQAKSTTIAVNQEPRTEATTHDYVKIQSGTEIQLLWSRRVQADAPKMPARSLAVHSLFGCDTKATCPKLTTHQVQNQASIVNGTTVSKGFGRTTLTREVLCRLCST